MYLFNAKNMKWNGRSSKIYEIVEQLPFLDILQIEMAVGILEFDVFGMKPVLI